MNRRNFIAFCAAAVALPGMLFRKKKPVTYEVVKDFRLDSFSMVSDPMPGFEAPGIEINQYEVHDPADWLKLDMWWDADAEKHDRDLNGLYSMDLDVELPPLLSEHMDIPLKTCEQFIQSKFRPLGYYKDKCGWRQLRGYIDTPGGGRRKPTQEEVQDMISRHQP